MKDTSDAEMVDREAPDSSAEKFKVEEPVGKRFKAKP